MTLTKIETSEIIRTNNKMAKTVQSFFMRKFDFKRVDKEYLTLTLNDKTLELRVFGLPEGMFMSVVYFDDTEENRKLKMTSIQETYSMIKQIVKRENKRKEE